MLSAAKSVVAFAIVALFGGLLLAGLLATQQPDEISPAIGSSTSPSPSASVATPAPTLTPSPRSDRTAEEAALQQAIASNVKDIELLQRRLDNLRAKSKKTAADRSEIVLLSGQISGLQRDIQLLRGHSRESVAAEAIQLLGELQAALPAGWFMPAVATDAIVGQRIGDIGPAIQASIDALAALMAADAARPEEGIMTTYRVTYESADTVEVLRSLAVDMAALMGTE